MPLLAAHRPEGATRRTPALAALAAARRAASAPAAQSGERCACGGGCPRCSAGAPVQAKLAVSQPGDRHERQADRVADAIVSPGRSASDARAPGIDPARPEDAASASLPVPVDRLEGEGRALPDAERRLFESRLGRDLSGVRVHTDAAAASAAQALRARAFTRGRDIYFGAGEFRPNEGAGAHLLAHELVHTVQQADADAADMPIMRAPPATEDAAARQRRLDAVRDTHIAIENLQQCLKALCEHEHALPDGSIRIEHWGEETIESKAVRDARVGRLIADLQAQERELAAGPVPPGSFAMQVEIGKGLFSGFDIDNFYARNAVRRGVPGPTVLMNVLYIQKALQLAPAQKPPASKPKPKPQHKPPARPTEREIPRTPPPQVAPPAHFEERLRDEDIVVPDPQGAPLVYYKVSRYRENRGSVFPMFRDERGYFYKNFDGKKVYLPDYKPGWVW